MKKNVLIFICTFLLISCTKPGEPVLNPVVKGVFDAENIGSGDIKILEGDWIFVPNKFVDPSDDFLSYGRFENINTSWDKYGDGLPLYGYGTYAVKIKNIDSTGVYAIKTSTVSSAFVAYLDGREIYRIGTVGHSCENEVFNWDASFIPLPTLGKEEVTLVFHISNFKDNKSGFLKPIEFGFYSTILNAKNKSFSSFTIISAILLLIAAFFLALFIFYPKERQSLYFGLLAANFCLRICCYDEFLLTTIIPQISGNILFRTGYITLSLGIIFFGLYVNNLFGKIKEKYLFIIHIPAILYIGINIFAPMQYTSSLLTAAQIYLLIMAFYNLTLVIKSAFKKDKSALFFLIGLTIFLSLGVRDILIANRIIDGSFVAHLGILILLIPMAIVILNNFKDSSNKIAGMTKQIETTNEALAKFVPNEFMNFLSKKHVDIKLGDNILKDMYIAFIHLGIYTGLTTEEERLTLLKIYNQTLAKINPVIQEHNGFIDKYLTEGLMVLFYGSADDVIKCMFEIQSIVQFENMDREVNNLPKIVFSVGIHYGRLMLGTIGEEQRMDNTVISDVVNVASRLHFYALKKGINIFISEAVKNNTGKPFSDTIEFAYNGLVKFRGKDEPIRIYEVKKT
ncbi:MULTISPECIES: adenylate/guanylate cyclase domain-containing protein [unclassified Treponema]|uniref:adenylate/guanylate cyclase domain-containing protein n=1 Tax=unclassified Treponema TaxID=2638727 RepID=UPI0020A5EBA2|nr:MULTISPECIES: adenylate/guanylate cyclase domain-containing protein [unclassified Treponema]UTC66879.1 adenylate/guanylate cyclase domain-containing protein [Treponema sp. OMZ 789]UTC69608.1 adenylate/guanylate cyclase domain-containing protein [Treponema sp. OMZ 790]UTC72322.1 adenylate/guanylate cyclase domain-containing protein [Treponema sp. OMZ 791]